MAAEQFPYEDTPKIEQAMQWILDDLFHNKQPAQNDLEDIPPNLGSIVTQLDKARQESGELGVKKAFKALCENYPWLKKLKSKPIPPRAGTEDKEYVPRTIEYVRDDALENMPPREWLIAGILPREGVAILFGMPGTFKSFLAIDWALSIGFGYGWLGLPVKQGSVVYIAGEGKAGLGDRIKAWKSYHGKRGNSEIRWITQSVDLSDFESIIPLHNTLDEISMETQLELVVIDTFSRNSGDADENSNKDVKIFMRELDRMKERYKCTILLIHHVGKDPSKGIRGASAFTGDTETNICLERVTDNIKMSITKQKDAEPIKPIFLATHSVMYDPQEESSIVLVKSDAPIEDDEDKVSTKESVQIMYDVLIGKELTATDWVALGMEQSKTQKKPNGMSKRTAMNARQELYDTSKVWYKKDSKLYYVPEKKSTARSGDESPKERKNFSLTDAVLNVLKHMEQEKEQGIARTEWMQEYAKSQGYEVKDVKNSFSGIVDTLLMEGEICCNNDLYSTARKEEVNSDE